MKIRAIAQARMKSERLPGKVLMKIGDQAIVEHIAARLATLAGAGVELCFAIADEGDITLGEFLKERGLAVFTGDEANVLKRYVDASADLDPSDYVIRVTADNPFVDKDQLASLVHHIKSTPVDYAYTADLPLGMGAELIRVEALRSVMLRDVPLTAGGEAGLKAHHREHVTTYIREHPHLYEIFALRLDETISDEAAKHRTQGIRMTVDEEADLAVVRRVFAHFDRLGRPLFGAVDVIQLARNNPEMVAGNQGVQQKAALSAQQR